MTDSTQHPDDDYLHLDLTEPDEDGAPEDGPQLLNGPQKTQTQTETGTLAEAVTTAAQIQTLPRSDAEMESGTMTPGGTVVLLTDSLNSHSDEHVFLDFVHDPLSHAPHDSIVPGAATVVDGHDPHTDSGLSIALDPQHTALEDIDIQRPFVDLLGSHSTPLSALDWAAASLQQTYGSLMDMELHKGINITDITASPTTVTTSTTTTTARVCVTINLIFQPNGIYVDAQSDSEAGTESSSSSGKPTKPIHPSILRPLTPEEVMVPIAVRRSNRTRQPSNLAVQSSEYLMQSQGLYGPANPVPATPGQSAPAPAERMTRSKKVYCYCQKPDDGNVMIQCDNCRQWFHGACVDITEEVAEMMELKNEKFFCEPCDERVQDWKTEGSSGIGNASKVFSDSRDCDLPTCLNEARATSDYCSEECAIKGIELQATEAVMNKENIPPVIYIPNPKRVSTSNASSSTQPESPKVEQDPVRLTALKGLTECLLVGFEVKSADGSESQGESSEQSGKESGTKLEEGAEGTVAGKTEAAVDAEQASRLAVAIEKELYSSTASPGYAACGRDYKAKYRSLLFNLKDKNNVILRARLVSGELEPYDLVRLSHEELANPELQNIKKEMRKKSIHDSVLTVEEEPYIKKTHKGELSFVPRLSSVGGPSTVPSLDHARSDDSNSVSSGSGDDEHHQKNNNNNNSRAGDSHKSNTTNLSDYTQKSGDNTNINSNMDSTMDYVESQNAKQVDKNAHEPSTSSPTGSPSGDVLDKLLARIQTNKRSNEGATGDILAGDKRQRRMAMADNGDEVAEGQEDSYLPREPSPYSPSPPGSPTIQSTTPPDSPPPYLLEELQRTVDSNRRNIGAHRTRPTVWQGSLSMHQVAKFSAKAVQIGGRELSASQGGSRRPAWSDVLTKDISVDGRIGIAAVETYVGQQAQSATKEIVVIKFDVQDPSSSSSDPHRIEKDKLFDYFHSKQRNGVVPQRNRHVKDMYLVPLAAKDPLPEYLRKVVHDDASVRGVVPKNCLLGVLILNKDPSHSSSSHHQSRRVQPSSSSHSKSASTSSRRRQPSPDTSRPYPETHHAHNHNRRPVAPPPKPSSPGHLHRSGEFGQSLKSPAYSGLPSVTIGTPMTKSLAGPSQLSPSALSHQPPVPTSALHSAPSTAPAVPKKIPTLQELQGLVNQLFPSAGPAPTLATGSPVVDPRAAPTPGPTAAAAAAAAAVSAQLNGTNLSSLMASLPASLGMSHVRQPPPQRPSDQFQPPPSVSQGNPYGIPPAHPVFPSGMPAPGPHPSLFPLPPYLMGQYGMPMAPPMHPAPPALPPSMPPVPPSMPLVPPSMPPVPPNPQQYFAHYFPGQEHLPSSAPPASHPSFVAPSPSMNARGNGPHDPRWSGQ
ncbi:PHD finger protein 3 [Mortierella sp. 14UC]|nr:PHD finger protein 3 [Mortierella sp. 14UC]